MQDIIIIGAGVIGSAVAYYLSQYDVKVTMLEASNDVSNGTSKANSAIIHAGYDPAEGTLMAKMNVEGSRLTKELCKNLSVPYQNNGALVLAFSDEDLQTINELYHRGVANGVEDLHILNGQQVKELEPEVSDKIVGALLANTSAIISPWQFTLALAETAVRNGVELHLKTKVTGIEKENDIFTVHTNNGDYQAKYIINATGVNADKIHEMIGEKEFTITPVRGQYYLLDKSQHCKAKHTLFQCPNKDGKGVLVSPTCGGNLIVGPDAEKLEEADTSTTAEGLAYIKNKALLSVPSIDFRENVRNFAGIRARSDRDDFIMEESKSVPNFYNLAGMGSPALSSAAAIGVDTVKWVLSKEEFAKKESYVETRKVIRFKTLNEQQKNELIQKDPRYGRVICRCETITEGDIMAAFDTPIPPCSIDGVKRRTNAGMGRCQGGFCGERVAMILKEQLNLEFDEILQDGEGSNILETIAKGGSY